MTQEKKDFYGKEVTAVIAEACREFGVSQEELDIEVLETGSAGIFGLCKKKAHIRVKRKASAGQAGGGGESGSAKEKKNRKAARPDRKKKKGTERQARTRQETAGVAPPPDAAETADQPGSIQGRKEKGAKQGGRPAARADAVETNRESAAEPPAPPSEEQQQLVRDEVGRLLELMGYPSTVETELAESSLVCRISGRHEEVIIGQEGRTLDGLQYLVRKMVSRHLPERTMLTLDAGDFRQRRAEELRARALQLAAEVRETGKTQAIPALNPAERRAVHMVLQEDKEIRSRSVGDGLFKKVLIYRPSRGQKSQGRRRRGRSGGRSSDN